MRKIVDPQQTVLFDSFDAVLTAKIRQRLLDGWQGIFREVILQTMPVEALGRHFDPAFGRPTKELYSMAGLLLIKEFMDWTAEQALEAYSLDMGVHYALNLEPICHDLSRRTLERYEALFEQDDLAKTTFDEITKTLVDLLDQKIDQQRLDSTHIFSNMASFGRTRLMAVTIKRFLTQLIRHDKASYETLEQSLRQRYAPGENQMFSHVGNDAESRLRLRQQVAEDMHVLVKRFADDTRHNQRSTYQALERIFYEQCEVQEEKVIVKACTGGDVMQTPPDPDATYDAHKGQGYQVQIAETCHPDNEAQLITGAIPQTACQTDSDALKEVLADLTTNGLQAEQILADTHYAGDDNVQYAQAMGVEIVGPVSGQLQDAPDDPFEELSVDDFAVDPESKAVTSCPAGHCPQQSQYDTETEKTTAIMPASACGLCEHFGQCPVRKVKGQYRLEYTEKQRRLAGRRREQATEIFRERYRVRSGIEGTNSCLKRRLGLGRLRVRGRPSVFRAIYLKLAGWNILRASVCAKMRKIVHARANQAVFAALWVRWMRIIRSATIRNRLQSPFQLKYTAA